MEVNTKYTGDIFALFVLTKCQISPHTYTLRHSHNWTVTKNCALFIARTTKVKGFNSKTVRNETNVPQPTSVLGKPKHFEQEPLNYVKLNKKCKHARIFTQNVLRHSVVLYFVLLILPFYLTEHTGLCNRYSNNLTLISIYKI